MTISELFRFLKPLKDKIALMIGVAILTAVNNSEKTQKLQIQIFGDETYDGMPRMQEYGFETYPDTSDANNECLVLSIAGNKNIGLIACVHNRELRPKDLVAGEVCIYTSVDSTSKHRIHFKADGSIEILTDSKDVLVGGTSGHKVLVTEDAIPKHDDHTHTVLVPTHGLLTTEKPDLKMAGLKTVYLKGA